MEDWLLEVEGFDTDLPPTPPCCHADHGDTECLCDVTPEGGDQPLTEGLDPQNYTPACDLVLDRLPAAIRCEKALRAIQQASRRVVRIINKKISRDRPQGDQFKNCTRTRGTGFVVYRNENTLVVSTNKHVIFNAEEAQNSQIWLNYDGGDSWKHVVKIPKGVGTIKTIADDDFTLAIFQIQTDLLYHKDTKRSMEMVKFIMAHIPDKELFQTSRRLELTTASADTDASTVVCLVSHPEGGPKQVSFGKLLSQVGGPPEASGEAGQSVVSRGWGGGCLHHTAPSRPGSSGAPLLLFSAERLPVPPTSIWYHVAKRREDPGVSTAEGPPRKIARLQVNDMKLFNIEWTGSEPVFCDYARKYVHAVAPAIKEAIVQFALLRQNSGENCSESVFKVAMELRSEAERMFFSAHRDESGALGTQLGRVILKELGDVLMATDPESLFRTGSATSESIPNSDAEARANSPSGATAQAQPGPLGTRQETPHPAFSLSKRLAVKMKVFNWICMLACCMADEDSPVLLEWPCPQDPVRSALADVLAELVREEEDEGQQPEEAAENLQDILESFDLIEDALPCPCQAVWEWLRRQDSSSCPFPSLLSPSTPRPPDAPFTWPWPHPHPPADVSREEPRSCILHAALTSVSKAADSTAELWDELDDILRLVHLLTALKRRWRRSTLSELGRKGLQDREESTSSSAPERNEPPGREDEELVASITSFMASFQDNVGAITLFNYYHSHPIFSLDENGLIGTSEILRILLALDAEDDWMHLMNHFRRHNNFRFLKKTHCKCGRPEQGEINDASFRVRMLLKKAEAQLTEPPTRSSGLAGAKVDSHRQALEDMPSPPSPASGSAPEEKFVTPTEENDPEEEDPVDRLLEYWKKSDGAFRFMNSSSTTEEFARLMGSSEGDLVQLLVGTLPCYAELGAQLELCRHNAFSCLLRLEDRLLRGLGGGRAPYSPPTGPLRSTGSPHSISPRPRLHHGLDFVSSPPDGGESHQGAAGDEECEWEVSTRQDEVVFGFLGEGRKPLSPLSETDFVPDVKMDP